MSADVLFVACPAVLQYGSQDVMLSAAEQLVDRSQTRAVADALKWLQARLKQQQQQQGGKTLRQWLDDLEAAFDQQVSMCFFWYLLSSPN